MAKFEDLTEILTIANSICLSILCTIENEVDHKLSLLDILIEREEDYNYQTTSSSVFQQKKKNFIWSIT